MKSNDYRLIDNDVEGEEASSFDLERTKKAESEFNSMTSTSLKSNSNSSNNSKKNRCKKVYRSFKSAIKRNSSVSSMSSSSSSSSNLNSSSKNHAKSSNILCPYDSTTTNLSPLTQSTNQNNSNQLPNIKYNSLSLSPFLDDYSYDDNSTINKTSLSKYK